MIWQIVYLMRGWQVPAYPLPKNLENEIIQRLVIRADFGMNMAFNYVQDIQEAIDALNKAHILFHQEPENKTYGFYFVLSYLLISLSPILFIVFIQNFHF